MERLGKLKHNLLLLIITFFGSGLISKKIPGTIGSLLATIILFFIPKSPSIVLIFAIASFIIGWICCELYIPKYETNKDPGYIVVDEACGIFLGAAIIYSFNFITPVAIILNFLFFRVFDIWKPFPIRNIEKTLSSYDKTVSLGIMLDDILAAIFGSTVQVAFLNLLG